jgi:N-acetylneuraminic acid mutarotase
MLSPKRLSCLRAPIAGAAPLAAGHALAVALALAAAPPDAHACSPGDWNAGDFEAGLVVSASASALASVSSSAPLASSSFPATAWSTAAPLAIARQEVAVAELAGLIYVIGGIDGVPSFTDSVEVYDPATDSWSPGPSLTTPLHHTTAASVDGKLYAIGGWADFFATPLDVVYELDPQVGSWVAKTPMPTPRGSPAAAALGGKIYVGGGWPLANAQDFAVYDPGSDTWQTLPDLPSGRNHLGLAAADGRIFAVGGRTALEAGVGNVATVDVFDPLSETWGNAAPLPRARGGLASVGEGGLIFAFGGEGNGESPDGTFPDADVYDAATDGWSPLPDMPTPRHGIGAVVVDGAVHIPGGGPIENFSVSDVHEALDVRALLAGPVPGLGLGGLGVLVISLAASTWVLRRG